MSEKAFLENAPQRLSITEHLGRWEAKAETAKEGTSSASETEREQSYLE